MRTTGLLSHSVAIGTAFDFKDSAGRTIAFAEEGNVGGTLSPDERHHTFDQGWQTDEFIKNNWQELKSARPTTVFNVGWGLVQVLDLLLSAMVGAGVVLIAAGIATGTTKPVGYRDDKCYYDMTHQWEPCIGVTFVPKDETAPPGTRDTVGGGGP